MAKLRFSTGASATAEGGTSGFSLKTVWKRVKAMATKHVYRTRILCRLALISTADSESLKKCPVMRKEMALPMTGEDDIIPRARAR